MLAKSAHRHRPLPIYPMGALVRAALRLAPMAVSRWAFTPPGAALPPAALAVWQERPDLQATFNLRQIKSRQHFATWFVTHAFAEGLVDADASMARQLAPWHAPWPVLTRLGPLPISWLMRTVLHREGFAVAGLRDPQGQRRLLSWYARVGLAKYGWLKLLPDVEARAMAAAEPGKATPRILEWLWEDEADLRAQFAGPDDPAFYSWLREQGGARWPVLADPRIGLAKPHSTLPWLGYAGLMPAGGRRRPNRAKLPFGVNLVGHVRGRLGVGEDVRMAAASLSAVGVPFVMRDVAVGREVETDDDGGALSTDAPYRFTMFCTTAMETVRAAKQMGEAAQAALAQRFAIGFWPWELPELPVKWHHAYGLVDEVWASSRYTHDAYARSSPVPLRHMPMAVDVTATEGRRRADYGLPADRFLFVFNYDGLSRDARKNPEAALAAFLRAFPMGDEPVGLVVKGHRTANSPAWAALTAHAKADPRLYLIDQSLSRGALLDLYRGCDAFVSLHRAEGFGRNIAECMALGKPVVSTAHSGNMDFTRSHTAALVPARLVTVAAGEYPFSTGQIWADPDSDAAALQMARLVEDAAWRKALASAGAARIARDYAPAVVGRKWLAALRQIDAAHGS